MGKIIITFEADDELATSAQIAEVARGAGRALVDYAGARVERIEVRNGGGCEVHGIEPEAMQLKSTPGTHAAVTIETIEVTAPDPDRWVDGLAARIDAATAKDE